MRLITPIKASNLLSFGLDGLDLELRDLNVLIGPNGSGKSNFLEIFDLLRSFPRNEEDSNNLLAVLIRGGGASEWICKASNFNGKVVKFPIASLEISVKDKVLYKENYIKHILSLDLSNIKLFSVISKESIDINKEDDSEKHVFYNKESEFEGFPIWNDEVEKVQSTDSTKFELSILSQRHFN